jgi:hypothetical protein
VRQFDLVENPSERTRDVAPYLLILQSHLLDAAESIIVAPVVRDARTPIKGVDLIIEFEGERLTVTLVELFSMPRAPLRTVRGDLTSREDELRRGLDRLFTGF